ncbi:DUF2399 domain-containing protein [Enterococcus gilvus]|uniref:DUF2399 domain-containing protein n=1 Tax=Enterococcus gilvus TaxID=160453 RepID=UPI003F502CD5
MTQSDQQKKEAVHYFASPAFKKFFVELSRKYYHRGDFGKSVGLQKFSEEERSILFHFMGDSEWEWRNKKSISVPRFMKSYADSRFVSLPFSTLVEEVTGKQLVYKDIFFKEESRKYLLFKEVLKQSLEGYAEYLSEEKKKSWFKIFRNDEVAFVNALTCVAKALTHLPKQYEKIPYFAYRLFRDPHQLDSATLGGRLFFDFLEAICRRLVVPSSHIGEAEWENIVYEYFYLLKDDSYNAVQTNGLTAIKMGEEVAMWSESAEAGISWNVPLKHILEVDSIRPFHGNRVLFIENSGVFSILCSAFPKLPVVCSSGQFKYSVWKIIEKLIAGKAKIYYSGDLDPAGLHIAQKLLLRFEGRVHLLLMDKATYKKVPKEVTISEKHLRQLSSITAPQLIEVRNLMKQEALAGYQEGLLDELCGILEQWEINDSWLEHEET